MHKNVQATVTQSRYAWLATYLYHSLRKTVEKASPILVTLTSPSNSDVKSSNVSLKENKSDGVNPNSNEIDYHVRKNEGKILWFSADCISVNMLWSNPRDKNVPLKRKVAS